MKWERTVPTSERRLPVSVMEAEHGRNRREQTNEWVRTSSESEQICLAAAVGAAVVVAAVVNAS